MMQPPLDSPDNDNCAGRPYAYPNQYQCGVLGLDEQEEVAIDISDYLESQYQQKDWMLSLEICPNRPLFV